MGLSKPTNWLVCYDIAERKRLVRVFKLLRTKGIPIQHSVFLVQASATEMQTLESMVEQIIESNLDDVRFYRIPIHCHKVMVGRHLMTEDMIIGGGLDSL